ncbi:MAG TPA: hypothetical protein VGF44_08765 [Terriglobales bacterium]
MIAPRIFSMLSPISAQGSSSSGEDAAKKAYGSGHFGEWMEDEFSLPAYRYTCNQINDPKAVTEVTPGIFAATEHVHQIGNDRIIALASNYGHVRVRQDEGSPKFLNDYVPENYQFGGGFGYLADGQEFLTTFYSESAKGFDRIFGIGYFRKRVVSETYTVDQVISAPFGDDPVLLSQVTITNHGKSPAELRWIEYWGCQNYQFSFRSFIESWSGVGSPLELRRQFSKRFANNFQQVDGGLLGAKNFLGRAPEEDAAWQRMKAALAAHPTNFVGTIGESAPDASFEDLTPPAMFLVSLDAPADGFATDGKAFFGAGGALHPDGINRELNKNLNGAGDDSAMLLERRVHLKAGESQTLYFLYGYLPHGTELEPLVARYCKSAATAWKNSSAEWKKRGMRFSVGSEPWIERETIWNHYYLRSSLTYDDYFQQHILNQNGFYQYVMGFQGAARDPLQHCLPFLFSDPEIVKSVLRYTLKEVRPDGSLPYAIVGHGVVAPLVTDKSSDVPLWLLWTASEYVLATRDKAFLDEEIPARIAQKAGPEKDTVRNLLARCFKHQVEQVGVGKDGIVRMLNDDWNDGLVAIWAAKYFEECVEQGISVLNSAMSAWVFDFYARMLSCAGGNSGLAAQAKQSAETNREAARKQWTGKWLKRAWLGPTLGWLGESTLWIEPQPWAILGGITTPEQGRALAQTIDELLRGPSPIGAMQMNHGPDMLTDNAFAAGTSCNGGIWPSLNQTLIWALAGIDKGMAWDEWKKNSFARHADQYPEMWYGIWSGPDTYNSIVNKKPGETLNNPYFHGTDLPVLNLHSHACSLYSASKLVGIEFLEEGLAVAPELPVQTYKFEASLVGVSKSMGAYEGWYAPSQAGTWTIKINLPKEVISRITKAEVNGKSVDLEKSQDGLQLQGRSEPGQRLRWRIS